MMGPIARKRGRRCLALVPVLAVVGMPTCVSATSSEMCLQAEENMTTNYLWRNEHDQQEADPSLGTSTCSLFGTHYFSAIPTDHSNIDNAAGIFSGSSVGWDQDDDTIGSQSDCPVDSSLRDEINSLRNQVEMLMQQNAAATLGQCCRLSEGDTNSIDEGKYEHVGGDIGPATLPTSTLSDAAAAGAIIGLSAGGPLLGVVGAMISTYTATTPGPIGDVSRAFGDLVAVVCSKGREINKRHGILDRLGNVFQRVRRKAAVLLTSVYKLERERRIVDKTKVAVVAFWMKMVEFEREHRVVDELSQKTAALVRSFAQVLASTSNASNITKSEGG